MSGLRVCFVKGVVQLSDLPRAHIPEIAFSGRSNVGKSSLLNRLAGMKALARVSRTPGKTREINFYSVADRFHLVDLPGYGYARVPDSAKKSWGPLVEGYFEERKQLGGVIQLLDLRHGPTELDRAMIEWLEVKRRPILLAATKQDKLTRQEKTAALDKLSREFERRGAAVVGVSSLRNEGINEVWKWIEEQCRSWRKRNP
ncbi:MAG TPA: ribosome biogenesis GTP-binding protein YihA/YsxC [bacterium]|nr:ribosome biogenesis GTP-binding protein YihA/YsxC [bacterium]